MTRLLACFALLVLPETLSESIQSALAAGSQTVQDIEIWTNKAIPVEKVADVPRGTDFPQIPHGALIGVIRYSKQGSDSCGRPIAPGAYTMRFCLLPEDGDHQGVAPRRDFVLLSPVAVDRDAAARPSYEALVEMSRKASGTNHPAILFVTTATARQVVKVKSGAVELGIQVAGKLEE